MGCMDGVTVHIPAAYSWAAGSYHFRFLLDGEKIECRGVLPFASCEQHIVCSSPDAARIMESGCALPRAAHGFGDILLPAGPLHVSLRIEKDGRTLAEEDFTPLYHTVQPNGAGCAPVCRQADVTLALPFGR